MSFKPTRDQLRNLRPKVYEQAAKMIHDKVWVASCVAISYASDPKGPASDNYYCNEREAWFATFGPVSSPSTARHPFWDMPSTPLTRARRVTSLLTMAAMVRDAKASRGKKKSSQD